MNPIIILLAILISTSDAVFNDIAKETKLKKNEKVIVIYQTAGACIKCFYQPSDIIDKTLHKLSYPVNIKQLAFVRCQRKKEMVIFKKQFKWEHYMLIDKPNIRTQLGINTKSAITVFDHKGNILLNIIEDEYNEASKKLYNVLKN